MTEEQLRIARNTYTELNYAKMQFEILSKIIRKGHYGVNISNTSLNDTDATYLSEDEMFFLTDLLEYRRKEVIALEKEFANL